MKEHRNDLSALASTLDDEALSLVSGGLTVGTATQPQPTTDQTVYEYAEALGRYFHAVASGGYGE